MEVNIFHGAFTGFSVPLPPFRLPFPAFHETEKVGNETFPGFRPSENLGNVAQDPGNET